MQQQTEFALPPTGPGLLRVDVRERGISVTAQLVAAQGAAAVPAATPIEHFGSITLIRDTQPEDRIRVRVRSVDVPALSGLVCVRARWLARPTPRANAVSDRVDASRVGDAPWPAAARWLARAAAATYARDWAQARDADLAAARLFDRLGDAAEAAAARHAVAQLEYSDLRQKHDSVAMISAALALDPSGEEVIAAVRLTLLAKTLLEPPQVSDIPVARVHALLAAAARHFGADPSARRELPRLVTLESYLQYRLGRPTESFRFASEAAADCQALADGECFARARMNQAVLSTQLENYAAALTDYEEALAAVDASRMPALAADVLDNAGELESRVGLFTRSEEAQIRALQMHVQLGNCDGIRRSAAHLGSMLVDVGSLADAQSYLLPVITDDCRRLIAALALRAAPGSSAAEPAPLGGSSHPRTAAWRCGGGLSPADLTLESREAVFTAMLDLAEIARLQGRATAARECASAAGRLALSEPDRILLANTNGELLLEQHQLDAAQTAFDSALELTRERAFDQSSELGGTARLGLARTALARGSGDAAIRYADDALELAAAQGDVAQVAATLRVIAASDAALKRGERAVRTLRTALRLIEQVPLDELDAEKRALYLATQHDLFAELTELLAARATAPDADDRTRWEAFTVAEDGHARSLRFALTQTAQERDGSFAARHSSVQYRSLLARLSGLASGSRALHGPQLLDGLSQLSSGRDIPPLARDSLERGLRALDAVLVEYAVGRDDLFAFVDDGNQVRVRRLGDRESIAHAAAVLSDELRRPEPDVPQVRGAAAALAEQVLWPIESALTRTRVIVVPDDALHTVPFAVLPWSRSADAGLLVQRAELASLPAASMLRPAVEPVARARARRFVLVGDPVFRLARWQRTCPGISAGPPGTIRSAFDEVQALPSLPGTREEVLSVAELARRSGEGVQVEVLLGCAATPAALREASPGAALLHIATHGIVDAERPRLSALALTPASADAAEAAFRLLDVLQLPLRGTRLVTLSACDTSRGRLIPGEGVLGLAQAFLQAGAGSVLASYWRVDDAATTPFMKRLYQHLLMDRIPIGAALRRTQLEFLSDGRAFSWAAFGIYGRPDSTP